MIEDVHIQKSFWMLGKSLDKCLGCNYCRLGDNSAAGACFETLPTEVNPAFGKIPVAVNLFYGDPTLQVKYTKQTLYQLEEVKHEGPVCIITKGTTEHFTGIKNECPNLDLHFMFSIVGPKAVVGIPERLRVMANLIWAKREGVKSSIEFRPIIWGVNDDNSTIDNVIDIAKEYGCAVGYSGLQGKPDCVSQWKEKNLPYAPYPGQRFGYKKQISQGVEQNIRKTAAENNVPVFSKTACLISYTHGYDRDYNAHYYRPNEVKCDGCLMQEKCKNFHGAAPADTSMIPYEHEVIYKERHVCLLAAKGLCMAPTDDCFRISGNLIKTDVKLTSSDIRMTKWLTGMTVDADFEEVPQLNSFWDKRMI